MDESRQLVAPSSGTISPSLRNVFRRLLPPCLTVVLQQSSEVRLLFFPEEQTQALWIELTEIFPPPSRTSMSGMYLVKKGREHRKLDLHRDFTVASPAEFVTRFGGNRVIEKVLAAEKEATLPFDPCDAAGMAAY